MHTPPSVASLARAELATGEAMHSLALSGGLPRQRTPPRGMQPTPEHSMLRTLNLERGYDETLDSTPGIPQLDPTKGAYARTVSFKTSPYGRATRDMAKRELAKLAARPTPKRHSRRKDVDAHGFAMSHEQRALDARREASDAYDAAARLATRREAAVDRTLDALASQVSSDFMRTALDELRDRTLETVEAVVEWRQRVAALDDVQNVQTAPPPFLWEGANYLVTLANADDVQQILQATPDHARPDIPAKRNALLASLDVDALATAPDDGSLPTDAVTTTRSPATRDRLAFLRRRRVARALVAEERALKAAELRDRVAPGPRPPPIVQERLALSASELERVKPPALDPPELELLGYDSMPPLPIVATFTCLHLVLNPDAVQTHGRGLPDAKVLQSRPLRHTLLKAPRKLAQQLQAFDASRRLPKEVLQLLWPVLTAERFTAAEVTALSSAAGAVFTWLREVVVVQGTKLGEDYEPHASRTGVYDDRIEEGMQGILDASASDDVSSEDEERAIPDDGRLPKRTTRAQQAAMALTQRLTKTRKSLGSVAAGGGEVATDGPPGSEVRTLVHDLWRDVAQLRDELRGAKQVKQVSSFVDPTKRRVSMTDVMTRRTTSEIYCDPAFVLGGRTVILKLQSVYADGNEVEYKLGLHGTEHLLILVQEPTSMERWEPRALPSVEVDRLTGHLPSELVRMEKEVLHKTLKPLLQAFTILETGGNICVPSPSELHRFERVLNSVQLDIVIARPERSRGDGTCAPSSCKRTPTISLKLTAQPTLWERDQAAAQGHEAIEAMHLVLDDAELQVLLCHQEGLYERARQRWRALGTVASWIASRLRFERTQRVDAKNPSEVSDPGLVSRLFLDRSVPLPPQVARAPSLPQQCVFDAVQEGYALVLRLKPMTDGHADAKATALVEQPVTIDELRALAMPPRYAPKGESRLAALASLRQRVAVEWLRPNKKDVAVRRSVGDVPSSKGQAVLHLDRVVHREVRRISGVSVHLQALVQGRSLLFRACTVGPPPIDASVEVVDAELLLPTDSDASDDDERPARVNKPAPLPSHAPAFDLSRIVEEKEMRLLVQGELKDRQGLLHPYYRGALAAILAPKLKLVRTSGKSRVPGDDVTLNATSGDRYVLETMLVHEQHTVQVGVSGSKKRHLLGSLSVDDSTTLEEARKLIHVEFDEIDVPEDFRFVYRGAPCPRKQEPYRFAVECKPCLILAVKPTQKKRGAGYAWTTKADDDQRRLRDEVRRLKALNEGPEAMEEFNEEQGKRRRRRRKRRHAVRAGKALRVQNDDDISDAEKPAMDPYLVDQAPPELDVVAVPLECTASTTQGSRRLVLTDDLALFDVTSADVLRVGSLDGYDTRIAKRVDWANLVPDSVTKFAFCPCDKNPTTHLKKRFYPLEDEPEAPPYLDDTYHAALLAMRGTEVVIGKEFDYFKAAPAEGLKKIERARLSAQQGRKSRTKHVSLDSNTGLEREEDEEDVEEELPDVDPEDVVPHGTRISGLSVYKLVPKALDMRPLWRIAFDEGLVVPVRDFYASPLKTEHFRVPLMYGHLESLVIDVRSRQEQIHEQRLHCFQEVDPAHLIDQLHHLLCSWYPQTEGVDGQKWNKFARDYQLIPGMQDPMRVAQVDLAMRRQFKRADGTYDRAGKMDRKHLRDALTEVAFAKFPIWIDPDEEKAKEHHAAEQTDLREERDREGRVDVETLSKHEIVVGGRGGSLLDRFKESAAISGKLGARTAPKEQNILAAFKFVARENHKDDSVVSESSEEEYDATLDDWAWFKQDTLKHLLFERTVMIPEINRRAWKEAKVLALLKEGRRQCASIRIQARHRMRWARATYLCELGALICVQAYVRRYIYENYYVVRREQMDISQLYRWRILCSFKLQAWMRYTSISREYRMRVAEERWDKLEKAIGRRREQHCRRLVRDGGTVFRRTKRMSGVMVVMRIERTDPSRENACIDYGMKLKVYVPLSQKTHTFVLEDLEVRLAIEAHLGRDGLSGGEILEPENLQGIADRLLIRVINGRPVVIFSRRGHSERGKEVHKVAKFIGVGAPGEGGGVGASSEGDAESKPEVEIKPKGNVYVVTCFHSDDEIVFHAYNNRTCETLRTSITTRFIKAWIEQDEQRTKAKERSEFLVKVADARKTLRLHASGLPVEEEQVLEAQKLVDAHNLEKIQEEADELVAGAEAEAPAAAMEAIEGAIDPRTDQSIKREGGRLVHPLLMKENLLDLLKWLIERLRVVEYRRAGEERERHRLILEYELEEVALEKAAMSLQGLWKMMQSLKRIRMMLSQSWEKRWDRDFQGWFYVNLKTGAMGWDPPSLLGGGDLPDPPDEWRTCYDEAGDVFYMNPYTGQTSWMSADDAARNLQKAYRAKQAADFGAPTFADIVRALRMIREVEQKYEEHPDRLSSMVNYALLLATQRFDLIGARKLYKDAMEISPENPVLLRAYGLFLLATLEAPRERMFRKTLDMFKNAELRDPGRERFEIAEESMFHWSCVAQRENPLALLNYALLQQYLVRDVARAERFFHRAISALKDRPEAEDPARPAVIENFELFELERLPGGEFHTPTPSNTVVRNSELVEEKPEWGEWGRYSHENAQKPKSAFYFWLNPITKRASWAEPDWEVAHRQRIERSEFVGEKQGWEQYWDPRFESNFFFNVMDGRLTCVDPVSGEGDEGVTLAQIEAAQNAPPPEPEPEPDGPMRALTAEEERAGLKGPMLLKNDPHQAVENAPAYKG